MKNTIRSQFPLIGEIYMVEFNGTGSVQRKKRPAIVFQNNVGNKFSPNVIVLPITSAQKKKGQPTHVLISAKDSGLHKDSMVLCENPQCVSKAQLGNYLTVLPERYMKQIAAASMLATGAIAYLDASMLVPLLEKATRLNAV